MEDYKDKTLQLLDRTLSLRAMPATRGGVTVDYTARRQAVAGVGVLMVVVMILFLLPARPPGAAPVPEAASPTGLSAPDVAPASAPAVSASGGARDLAAGPRIAVTGNTPPSIFLGDNYAPPGPMLGPAPGSVPPPAPIWMDGPWRFNPALRNKR